MFIGSWPLRVFFSWVSAALLLASIAEAQDTPSSAPAPVHITLAEAQARAIAGKAAVLAQLTIVAAEYHRKAAQADYFPKVGATFANLHFNKFMGQRIQVISRSIGPPILNKDETIVAVTVTQPVTPLFKVHQAVRIAKADERIAEGKKVEAEMLQADLDYRLAYAQLIRTEALNNLKHQGEGEDHGKSKRVYSKETEHPRHIRR